MHTYRELPCGHLRRVDLIDGDECPQCDDDAEAYAMHALDALLDDRDDYVVPHTRE